jgi:thioredoxin reductase (NADPH)
MEGFALCTSHFYTSFMVYDTIIIGLGAAGYTAAIYSARYKLTTLLIGGEEGGMGQTAAEVGNWPGDIEVRGPDLMERMKNHAKSFAEVTFKISWIKSIVKNGSVFVLTLEDGSTVEGKTIIFATGSKKRHLGVKGEEEFSGKGVTYCATCDAFFYKGKDVAVIGGGDSAVEGAAIAAQVAKRVYLIHRRNEFRAEPYWIDRVKAKDNITFVLENSLAEIQGDTKVRSVKLTSPFEGSDSINVDGVFIEVGSTPATELAQSIGCQIDEKGYLKVDAGMASTVPGIFGAGDVTNGSNYFAQFTTAAGEGAIAANSVFTYLGKQ